MERYLDGTSGRHRGGVPYAGKPSARKSQGEMDLDEFQVESQVLLERLKPVGRHLRKKNHLKAHEKNELKAQGLFQDLYQE